MLTINLEKIDDYLNRHENGTTPTPDPINFTTVALLVRCPRCCDERTKDVHKEILDLYGAPDAHGVYQDPDLCPTCRAMEHSDDRVKARVNRLKDMIGELYGQVMSQAETINELRHDLSLCEAKCRGLVDEGLEAVDAG